MQRSEHQDVKDLSFSFFFEHYDYLLEHGKGFSVFNAHREVVNNFLQKLSRRTEPILWRLSDVLDHFPDRVPEPPQVVVLVQDLSETVLQTKGKVFADKIVFPLWYKGVSICFFSFLEKSSSERKFVESSDIHQDLPSVLNFLLLEQAFRLLERVNYHFSSPEFLNLSEYKTIFTPIEELMLQALEQKGLDYQPQVRLGRYLVDFLVDLGNEKAIIECDGRLYHDPLKDQERDKHLSLEGYEIFRFTGSEIFSDPIRCVEEVMENTSYRTLPSYQLDENLDESQLKAVRTVTGPVRVLAPAGSGKTKTLVNRIYHLLNQGVREDRILALAFNRKAKEEMQARLSQRSVYGVDVRTFHSLGYEIIRNELGWDFQGDQVHKKTRNLMRRSVSKHVSLPRRRNGDPLEVFLDGLRRVKMELPQISDVLIEFEDKAYPFDKIFNSYLKEQSKSNFLNFDDMIYLALRLLINNDQIRKMYQEQFEYVLVDEYQDLNKAQLMMLQILALPQNNIFAVGDDDQLIYGWRGAEVRQIVQFDTRFPLAVNHVLETNYRSSEEIIKHAKWIIDNNQERVSKDIQPREGAQKGLFKIHGNTSLLEQAQYAVDWLLKLKEKNGGSWKDYAFLYRYNAMQFPVALVLDSKDIPHSPLSGGHIFDSRVAEDILSYLRVIMCLGEAGKKDFKRILNRPNKYLKNEILNQISSWNSLEKLIENPGLKDWEREKIIDFVTSLEYIQGLLDDIDISPRELLDIMVREVGLLDFYQDHSPMKDEVDTSDDKVMLEVLLSLAENFYSPEEFYQFAVKTREDFEYGLVEGYQEDRESRSPDRDEVYLSTIHKAKGKEFSNVIYFNLSDEMKSKEDPDIEEERRVVYVGATRAIDNLLITYPEDSPSKFLFELALNPEMEHWTLKNLENRLKNLFQKKEALQSKLKTIQEEIRIYEERIEKLVSLVEGTSFWGKFILTHKLITWRLDKVIENQEQAVQKKEIIEENELAPVESEILVISEELTYRNKLIQQ